VEPKILAIIPARGGSKSVPRKNIKDLHGKPLIAYTIEAAKNSKYINKVVLSTDDDEIAEVARKFGAETPFKQPAHTAEYASSALSAVLHALQFLEENESYKPEIVVYLQPTSPFRKSEHIDKAIKTLLEDESIDGVMGMTQVKQHPFMAFKKSEDGTMVPFIDMQNRPLRRQEMPELFATNASVYVTRRKYYDTAQDPNPVCPLFEGKMKAVIMENEDSIDMDDEIDFIMGEAILKKNEDRQ